MANKTFSTKEALSSGWELFKSNHILLVGSLIVLVAFSIISSVVAEYLQAQGSFFVTHIIWQVIITVVAVVVEMGLLSIMLAVHDRKKAFVQDVFSQTHHFWRYLGAKILYGLIVLGGLILLVVPGVIWAVKYQFFNYAIIDKKRFSPTEALRYSSKLTEGIKGKLLLFDILMLLINVLGFALFIVGLFITIPVTYLAMVFVYRKLGG